MTDDSFKPIGHLLPSIPKPKKLTPITKRLISFEDTEDPSILFQHSVLCQTSMPYRNPGDDVRLWERSSGKALLEIQAGRAAHPVLKRFVDIGLPFGAKPRLVLYHLNTEAMRTQSATIELEDSLTAFVQRTLGLGHNGRNIKTVKDQLTRLAAADFRVGFLYGDHAVTLKGTVLKGFDLWIPKDPDQKTLWPTTVQFSADYFDSLMKHAVPLNEAAIACLSHNAMALDIYTWLAQRLHRVKSPAFIPWTSLTDQFGDGYGRMRDFKRTFRNTLKQVRLVYPEAKFDLDDKGMSLRQSRPPIARRLVQVKQG